jgi:hypothetical protein
MTRKSKHRIAPQTIGMQIDMTDREEYLRFWQIKPEDAEAAWASKCAMTERLRGKSECGYPAVMGDIQPYRSMIDGSLIESRSKHRAHLKANNCIEIGNEVKHLTKNVKPLESPPGLKETLIRAVDASQRKRSY